MVECTSATKTERVRVEAIVELRRRKKQYATQMFAAVRSGQKTKARQLLKKVGRTNMLIDELEDLILVQRAGSSSTP